MIHISAFGIGTNSITETCGYNIRGWLTEKSSDVFDMRLRYHDPQQSGTTPSYMGNITEWEWKHKGSGSDNTPNSYAFTYDRLSRLTDSQLFQYSNSQWQRSGSFEEWLGAGDVDAYDKNGNILSLMRSSATGSIMDGFRYEYNGNQLTKLYLDWDDDSDFVTYAYDANGNCTVDGLNTLKLEYNYLNLTSGVSDMSDSPLATYTWLADGTKVGVKDASGSGFEYLGSLIYQRDAAEELTLESSAFGSGRIVVSEGSNDNIYTPNYFITDHLGSTRAVVESGGTVSERNNYLPFGGRWEVSGTAISDNRFRFSGKEEQSMFGLPYNDHGARMYDPRTGRWIVVDALAKDYYPISSYAFCLNNPVNAIDPDGKVVIFVNGNHFGDGAKGYISYSNANNAKNWTGTRDYWVSKNGVAFDQAIMDHVGDQNAIYRDGALGGFMGLNNPLALSNNGRASVGFTQGLMDAERVFAGLARDENGNIVETIKVISHSMGGAYAAGYIAALQQYATDNNILGYSIAFHAAFAPYQSKKQKAAKGENMGPTLQYSHSNDKVAGNNPITGAIQMDTSGDTNQSHSIFSFWNQISSLPSGNYRIENGQIVPY